MGITPILNRENFILFLKNPTKTPLGILNPENFFLSLSLKILSKNQPTFEKKI